jgi:predicted enzyme related to lactoylglutathione lyase
MSNAIKTAGRFYWHELVTADVEQAKGFYGELLGWAITAVDMGPMGTYWIASVGEKQVAGIAKAENGAQPGWLAYVTAHDVDETTNQAKAAGATVLVPPSDIPGQGRFSLLADAEGALFAPFRPSDESADDGALVGLGGFCWSELLTHTPATSIGFYAKLFDWGKDEREMGPLGTYTMFKRGDKQAAGAMKAMNPKAPAMWLNYVVVDNVDASYARAEKLGGKQLVPPMDLPGIGRSAVVVDPAGAMIALFKAA